MADILLVTGGSRSGKSRHALELGEARGRDRLFLATCPRLDEEMEQRIERHVEERRAGGWQTHEEQVDLAGALGTVGGDVVVVDCLTLWISNLMFHAGEDPDSPRIDETYVADRCGEVVAACRSRAGTVVFVTNEVGQGIVPDNALARSYRDLVGRCNQVMAAAADGVVLMVSGLPLTVK
jgi:adenosylcobinamide kinase/adenosylcobinamide-phosphate guanylyltransferase